MAQDQEQKNQQPQAPQMVTLKLRAVDVDNVLAFMERCSLQGSESTIHANLKQNIAAQAAEQIGFGQGG